MSARLTRSSTSKESRRKPDTAQSENEDLVTAKAVRMKRYREKLKNKRREKYEEMLAKDRERKKKNYQLDKKDREKSEAKKLSDREKWKVKQQLYRQKKSMKKNGDQQSKTRHRDMRRDNPMERAAEKRTDEALEEIRRLERDKSQKEKLKLKKKKAVVNVQKWRMKVKLSKQKQAKEGKRGSTTPFSNRMAESRALKKTKETLPGTPIRRARIIEKILTPRTTAKLEGKGIITTKTAKKKLQMGLAVLDSVKASVNKIQQGSHGTLHNQKKSAMDTLTYSVLGRITKYHRLGTAIGAHLKIRKPKQFEKGKDEFWKPRKRKERKDKLSNDVQESIKAFYLSPEISRQVPNMKDVKDDKQKHVMTMTLAEAFDDYKKANPGMKVGLTSFKNLKPANVQQVSETSHRTCLCQTCQNVVLKIEALKKFANGTKDVNLKSKIQPWTKKMVGSLTVCDTEGEFPNPECLDRTCKNCPRGLSEQLQEALDEEGDINMNWYCWQPVMVEYDGKAKRVTSCVQQATTLKDFITEFQKDLEKFPAHYFRATWQHRQLDLCIKNMTQTDVTVLMDYSENYRIRFQNEAQSAYFDSQQVTVHPFMCYYKEMEGEDEKEEVLVKHAIIAMSNDTRHDSFGVEAFEKKTHEILRNEKKEIKIIHKFSDGAACQYKGKNTFLKISKSSCCVVHNYFETSHGKSPCDGLGAVVKNACFNAVKSGKAVIGSANDAYRFCKEKLSHGPKIVGKGSGKYISKRNIVYVDKEDIKRGDIEVQTLPGTRALHSVKSTGVPYNIMTRSLSCYCSGCMLNSGPCVNPQYVEEWVQRELHRVKARAGSSVSVTGT